MNFKNPFKNYEDEGLIIKTESQINNEVFNEPIFHYKKLLYLRFVYNINNSEMDDKRLLLCFEGDKHIDHSVVAFFQGSKLQHANETELINELKRFSL